MVNSPLISVTVPFLVPVCKIVAPTMGSLSEDKTLPFAVICCCAETVRQNKTDNNNSSIRLLCWGRPVNHVNPFFSIIRV